MSLITQCPACATMFRVVPDQLRISDGWVRCGQCDEVFDANAHLQSLTPTETQAPAQQIVDTNASTGAYDWGAIVSTPESAALTDHLTYEDPDPLQNADLGEHSKYGFQVEDQHAQPDTEPEYHPEVDPFLNQSPTDLPAMEDSLEAQFVLEPNGDSGEGHSESELVNRLPLQEVALPDDAPLSFMPRESKATASNRFLGPPVLWSLCGLLVFALVGQWAVLERNRISAMVPSAKPALETLCDVLKCKIAAPRLIDAISIDSSTFTSIRSGVYVLSVTLKSSGTLALETPALELTLTDMQDKPLLRRVFLSNDYAVKQGVISAGGELIGSMPVSVHVPDGAGNIAGYKLLAFYP